MKAATFNKHGDEYFYGISIHAAREGGDVQAQHIRLCGYDFNPRRP